MRTTTRTACLSAISCLIFTVIHAQEQRIFNQNASRSNHLRNFSKNDAWSFGISAGEGFAIKSNESTLFRGNSIATKIFGNYYFGNIGLGVSGGIIAGDISNSSLNSFLTERKFPQDQVQITKGKPFNSYFLFGPSFRFGKRVEIGGNVQAGLFFNNPGGVTIGQSGATRPLYRFDAGDKNMFPGVSGDIHLAYPINASTQFLINTGYLQTKSSIRLFDPQRGIDVATVQNHDIKLLTAGIGIVKSFGGGRDAHSGQASGKKHIGNVKYEEITITTREAGSGMATGRIISTESNNGVVSPRDMQSGLPTGRRAYQPGQPVYGNRQMNESCGPVTLTTTNPDGTSEQRTFACPADAAQYAERISMNVTTPKQTQGSSFGEKVNQGLHAAGSALSQGASRGVIYGTINWGNGNAYGITTNEMAAVSSVGSLSGNGGGAAAASYAATGRMMNNNTNNYSSQGVVTTFYAREAGSGMATGRRSRDAGSGMATGRRQYEPVFNEDGNNTCTDCAVSAKLVAHELTHVVQQANASVKDNPLYNDNGSHGTNPMHERNSSGGNGGLVCGTTTHFFVILTNADNGEQVAQTKPDSCGNFWFANVPVGNYAVRIKGDMLVQKEYAVNINKDGKYDVAGEMIADNNQLVVLLNSSVTDNDDQKSKVIVRGWDPEKKESVSGSINDSKSATLLGSALPGGSVISSAFVAGNPIGGIIVKGGKNPGGSLRTTQTNEYGEFEFTDLEKGNYTITADLKYTIDNATIVTLGDNDALSERKGWDGTVKGGSLTDNAAMRKGWDGTVKGGSKTKAQDHNSSRSNKTSSLADIDTDNGNDGDQQQRKVKGKIVTKGDTGMLMVDADEPITFRWTPVVPKPQEPVTYKLKVWQLMQGQNGSQAMRSNQPLVEKTVTGANEAALDNVYTGPCKPPYLCDFIWSVQAISSNGTTGSIETGTFSAAQTKAQNNNTVRSNRTELKSILIEADLDGDGEYETDVTAKVNDEIILDENGKAIAPQQKAGISTSRSNIRNRSSLEIVNDGLYVSYGDAVINNKEVPVKSVLKTKHDTAKNSVGNIR